MVCCPPCKCTTPWTYRDCDRPTQNCVSHSSYWRYHYLPGISSKSDVQVRDTIVAKGMKGTVGEKFVKYRTLSAQLRRLSPLHPNKSLDLVFDLIAHQSPSCLLH